MTPLKSSSSTGRALIRGAAAQSVFLETGASSVFDCIDFSFLRFPIASRSSAPIQDITGKFRSCERLDLVPFVYRTRVSKIDTDSGVKRMLPRACARLRARPDHLWKIGQAGRSLIKSEGVCKHAADPLTVGAPRVQAVPRPELNHILAVRDRPQLRDAVDVHDVRSMDAQEASGIEHVLNTCSWARAADASPGLRAESTAKLGKDGVV